MEILTKTDKVFESSNNCPGCGSILGLKFLLQLIPNLKNSVLITSPGDIALLGKSGLKVNLINSRNPVATARGLSAARPDLNIVVYSDDEFTSMNLPSVVAARENFLYICCNNSGFANINVKTRTKEFASLMMDNAVYSATASVAYYEDLISKLTKAFSKTGFKFIDLLAPCPILWSYDSSNTIEVGRMATESLFWPLYEIDNKSVAITKIPPTIEQFQRFVNMLKISMPQEELQTTQDNLNRRWRALNEGKLM